jgi:hypothetical protein
VGERQIQKMLAAKDRERARSRVAWLVAGWLAKRLGVRASRIMGIEGGLSNLFSCLNWFRRREDHHNTLALQNMVKTLAAKTPGGPIEKRCAVIVLT